MAATVKTKSKQVSEPLVKVADELTAGLGRLAFSKPVTHVYNPLEYARPLYAEYVRRFGQSPREVVLVGMNPGPWGMAQTGVPFGEVGIVRDWLGLTGAVGKPAREHPARRVLGLECPRSEVSGKRLWGWARERFVTTERFFARFFVANYCPLLFMEASGRNLTPDKLATQERVAMEELCDESFRRTIEYLQPRVVIGVGGYAEKCARRSLAEVDVAIGRILHPSPASPAANSDWAAQATAQLRDLGLLL